MLDPWIIEEIRRREEERVRQGEAAERVPGERPHVRPPRPDAETEERPSRGVAVVDYKV